MKIAFVDHISVSGGIIRYATNLARAIKEADPSNELTFFTTEHNYNSNYSLYKENAGFFDTRVLRNTKKTISGNFNLDVLFYKTFRTSRRNLLHKEIYRKTKAFDIVYFTYAHASEFIPVKPRSVATYHDLNWKYLFGTPLYPASEVNMINREIRRWLGSTEVIVSSPYVAKEIRNFFPDIQCEIDIVFLPNLAKRIETNEERKSEVFRKFGIDRKYILCPAHLMPHKNHLNLFSAFHRFRQTSEGNDYMLILTGHATDHFRYAKAFRRGAQMASEEDFDIMGLGYVSNEEVDVLIKNASLIVSASLQEAGSGPALDAWVNEVPVILSAIDPHLEQIDFFKIDCHTFDPMSIDDICSKMCYAARNQKELADQSRRACLAFEKYSWNDVGRMYLEIFRNKIGK